MVHSCHFLVALSSADTKCRLSVQHLLKVFLGNKLFVKKRIRTISFVLNRLENETCDKTLKLRLRKMKLLNDEELFLNAISKRISQFEHHFELLFRTNKSLIKCLRKLPNLVELSKEFCQSISADDNEFFHEEGNATVVLKCVFINYFNVSPCQTNVGRRGSNRMTLRRVPRRKRNLSCTWYSESSTTFCTESVMSWNPLGNYIPVRNNGKRQRVLLGVTNKMRSCRNEMSRPPSPKQNPRLAVTAAVKVVLSSKIIDTIVGMSRLKMSRRRLNHRYTSGT